MDALQKMRRRKALKHCSYAIALYFATSYGNVYAQESSQVKTQNIVVESNAAEEEAKYDSQQKTIITKEDIEKKQAKSVEDIIFTETGISRTVDAMGRVGISIRGAEARHTLILVDGQAVLGDLAKYQGAADEVMRLGTENVERIEIIQGAASAKYGSDAIGGVVNIITKKATKEPGLQINMEGSRIKESDGLPYKNFFLRADSGETGKLRVGLSGSKRDIMPVIATEERRKTGLDLGGVFTKNALRFHGDASDIGLVASYNADPKNKFDFRLSRYMEDLHREIKNTDNVMEPQRIFKRKTARNSYNLSWNAQDGKNTDWNVEMNYTAIKEDDTSLLNHYGLSEYMGTNELNRVDDVDHRQFDIRASANTQINDNHLLTYGFGYTNEQGEGARVAKSPHITTRKINPWDYDKSLLVNKPDRYTHSGTRESANTPYVWSHVHDYLYKKDKINGMSEWDQGYEQYGGKTDELGRPILADGNKGISWDEYNKYKLERGNLIKENSWLGIKYTIAGVEEPGITEEFYKRYEAFKKAIVEDKDAMGKRTNEGNENLKSSNVVEKYFKLGYNRNYDKEKGALKLNGKYFMQEYWDRDQRITTGSGTIKKQNIFLGDTWQLSPNTILSPVIRWDHSNLFGSNISGNLGILHMVGGNPHKRLKANIGTSYAEPGMGELWYNWEMYGSSPVGIGVARMGWWWEGNPNLRPERSLNFDISMEGETKKTYARAGIFHNRIKDYMSIYFTGALMDFAPQLGTTAKWMRAPDMIYSFKNIGRAEITGIEAEVKQKFDDRWSAKLGYTYLHAINKSDPLMPKKLLDRPTHKIDIGISYEDKKTGWGGQIWGDYYLRMLDSNTLANGSNYWPDFTSGNSAVYKNQNYQEKSYGIWNVMVQKKFGDNALIYVGVNNIFNHHDDDRAMQERVYRMGLNFKFGGSSKKPKRFLEMDTKKDDPNAPILLENFIAAPFDTTKENTVHVFGDYRARLMSAGGMNRPAFSYTADGNVGSAAKNLHDKKSHGFDQRLRIGVDAKLGKNTQATVVASASGMAENDTKNSTALSRGFNKQRLEIAALTQHDGKWDFSLGRINEPMGVTGYWFGKEFDGARAVWTGKDAQIRVGYGSFKHNTGITDSPYTYIRYTDSIYRPPTIVELLGLNIVDKPYGSAEEQSKATDYETFKKSPENEKNLDKLYFYQQMSALQKSYDEKVQAESDPTKKSALEKERNQKSMEIVKQLHSIFMQAYPDTLKGKTITPSIDASTTVLYKIHKKDGSGTKYMSKTLDYSSNINPWDSPEDKKSKEEINKKFAIPLTNTDAISNAEYFNAHKDSLMDTYREIALLSAQNAWKDVQSSDSLGDASLEWDGTFSSKAKLNDGSFSDPDDPALYKPEIGIEDITLVKRTSYESKLESGKYRHYAKYAEPTNLVESLKEENYEKTSNSSFGYKLPRMASEYLKELISISKNLVTGNIPMPDAQLGAVVGNIVKTSGHIVEQDEIPAIERAAFLQAKKLLCPNLGIEAWYLRSVGDKTHYFLTAHGKGNDVYRSRQLANVFGIGFKYQLGQKSLLSFDYGQNRTDFGRYMNGHTIASVKPRESTYSFHGREKGGIPDFWVLRLDIGASDTNIVGSWNAFADYKAFQHGAFFGGNGTDALPDRYLDGMRSFTIGAGYVPRKNLLLEAFYTFGVKSLGTRDTLYGPEKFTLGNMSRVQMTYKF